MRLLRTCLALALVVALTGCIHTSYVPLGGTFYDPRSELHPILVYESETDVPYAYEKIARVVGDADEVWGIGAIIEKMKADVRELGGDAIVLRSTEVYDVFDDCGNRQSGQSVVGVAIRFLEEESPEQDRARERSAPRGRDGDDSDDDDSDDDG